MKADSKQLKYERKQTKRLYDAIAKEAHGERLAIENLNEEIERRQSRMQTVNERLNHLETILDHFNILIEMEEKHEQDNP